MFIVRYINLQEKQTIMNELSRHDKGHAKRDAPWIMRTYSGHSNARASNELYRANLQRGQTGLSIAFDLPTQTGYDSDHPLASGEVGKVGVPIAHLGDMRCLFEDIPLAKMNTSMTINATAPWLLALYVAVAQEQGVTVKDLKGTTQNDIIKEYLSRGTYIFAPQASMRLATDIIIFTHQEMPKWNPINICSYHLQEAGATPVQEVAYALANACGVIEAVTSRGMVKADAMPALIGRLSFFLNAGIQFVTELCKMRAFAELWDELTQELFAVDDARYRRFRYGVQVNSLGLTEQQPENNVYRILIEMLSVVLSKQTRARAIQLPAWNEALGLPRPWDQQWSLRLQQIMAYESDLLDYDDIFAGSKVIEEKVASLKEEVRKELDIIKEQGGILRAVESGYLKQQLVTSLSARRIAIEEERIKVVGVNCFTDSLPSPLTQDEAGAIFASDKNAEAEQCKNLIAWRKQRDAKKVAQALQSLEETAKSDRNIMPASIECAKAGVTTGEWAQVLREIFGDYRAPTGVTTSSGAAHRHQAQEDDLKAIREDVAKLSQTIGRRLRILVGKPGLDGHSNGAEQIAIAMRECGFEVIYQGIRLTPAAIVNTALEESVHVVGLSILSGSHLPLVSEIMTLMKKNKINHIPVVVGGIIPSEDETVLRKKGVAAIYTPKNFDMTLIARDMVQLIKDRAMS